MNIFKEARQRKKEGKGYRARRFVMLWSNKNVGWNWLAFEYGLRWSDKWQIFPIWNASDNVKRSLIFGVWKLYFQIIYQRKSFFNQKRKFFLRERLLNFYQLVS